MGKKGSKFLALFMVLAMIVTYSFSMSILSVYADDEQGGVNAKAAASEEDATPDKPDPKPQPEPEKPAPSDSGDQDKPSGDDSGQDNTGNNSDSNNGSSDTGSGNDSNSDSGDTATGDKDAVGDTDDSDDVVSNDSEETVSRINELVEEEEEETEYPEVTLHASAGGVSVTLHAPEGALPKGAKLSASKVSNQSIFNAVAKRIEMEGKEMTDAVAIDVTPRDKDGHAIQPKKPVTVTFSGTDISGNDIDVFRVSDDASSVVEMGTSVATAGTQKFSTNHFTIYVAAGDGSPNNPNGDGSGPNTRNNPYELAWGDSILLKSSQKKPHTNVWTVTSEGSNLVGLTPGTQDGYNVCTVKNNNGTDKSEIVEICFQYKNNHYEYFYVELLPQTVTVTFMYKAPGSDSFTLKEKVPVNPGDDCTPPTMEEVDNYSFYGWYEDTDCTIDANLINIHDNLTVYGAYAADTTIRYEPNADGDPSATVPADQTCGVGLHATISSDAHRDNYVLDKWTTEPGGGGDSYYPGDSAEIPEGGLTLYAQWVPADAITITYKNNHKNNDNSNFTVQENVATNSTVNLVIESPVRDDAHRFYLFRGWSTTRSGDPMYYPGQTYNTGSQNVVLYAVWGEIAMADLTILQSLTAKGDSYPYDGTNYEIMGVVEADNPPPAYENYSNLGPFLLEQDGKSYIMVGATHGDNPGHGKHPVYALLDYIVAEGTDVGSYPTPLSAELFVRQNANNMRKTGKFIPVTNNLVVITPVELEVYTNSAEQQYNGSALTEGGYVQYKDKSGTECKKDFVYGDGTVTLFGEDTLYIKTIGSQTDIGSTDNTWECDWHDTATTAKSSNYIVTEKTIGTLTVYLNIIFDPNAGGDNVSNMPSNYKMTEPDTALPDNEPVRDGFTFLGWAKKSGATAADYQPGGSISGITKEDVTSDGLVLYAVWEEEPSPGPEPGPTPGPEPGPTPEPTPTPEPVPDNPSGGGGGAAAAAPAVVAAAAAPAAAAATTFEPEPVPTTINDNPAPKAAAGSWALINLISAILTALLSLIMLVRYFGKKKDETGEATETRRGNGARLASIIPAIGGIAAFVATENMSNAMAMTDKWTVMMIVILAIQAGVGVFAKSRDNNEVEDFE